MKNKIGISLAYDCFLKAFKYTTDREGYGIQKKLSNDTKKSIGIINQVLRCKKRASLDTQERIANALNFSYEEFLSLGRNLLEYEQSNGKSKDADSKLKNEIYMELIQKIKELDLRGLENLKSWLDGYLSSKLLK